MFARIGISFSRGMSHISRDEEKILKVVEKDDLHAFDELFKQQVIHEEQCRKFYTMIKQAQFPYYEPCFKVPVWFTEALRQNGAIASNLKDKFCDE